VANSYIRYSVVRVADNTDDQQLPPAIAGALASSVTQEDLQVYLLSQVKRIIWGSRPGHWYTDFASDQIPSLSDTPFPAVGVPIIGTFNGLNRTFGLPDKFVYTTIGTGPSIELKHNGVALRLATAPDPRLGDYYVTESGGLGSGYDTINFLSFAPKFGSIILANYFKAR
jgi:hypothetical protein